VAWTAREAPRKGAESKSRGENARFFILVSNLPISVIEIVCEFWIIGQRYWLDFKSFMLLIATYERLVANRANCNVTKPPDDPVAKKIALSLLIDGIGPPSEIAHCAGVSRQVVENWARRAGIDWRKLARAKVAAAWRRRISNVSVSERRAAARHRVKSRTARARKRRAGQLSGADPTLADACAHPLSEMQTAADDWDLSRQATEAAVLPLWRPRSGHPGTGTVADMGQIPALRDVRIFPDLYGNVRTLSDWQTFAMC
jgi:hypothetical protein